MGRPIEQWAMLNSIPEDPEWKDTAEQVEAYRERRQRTMNAERLKEGILSQLEQGSPPENVLYSALETIGILTEDPEWTTAARHYLDVVYSDLQQQSFLVDNAAVAAARHEGLHREYLEKIQKRLKTCEKDYKKLQKALDAALSEVNLML